MFENRVISEIKLHHTADLIFIFVLLLLYSKLCEKPFLSIGNTIKY